MESYKTLYYTENVLYESVNVLFAVKKKLLYWFDSLDLHCIVHIFIWEFNLDKKWSWLLVFRFSLFPSFFTMQIFFFGEYADIVINNVESLLKIIPTNDLLFYLTTTQINEFK